MCVCSERVRVTECWCGGGEGVVSAGHVGDPPGSCIVSTAADVLVMGVVRGMRGVDGVCEMCLLGAA